MSDLRAAIQQFLDAEGDGWVVQEFVLALGLQRIVNGVVESTPWVWAPPEQPEWQTDGLLSAASDLRYQAEIDS